MTRLLLTFSIQNFKKEFSNEPIYVDSINVSENMTKLGITANINTTTLNFKEFSLLLRLLIYV